MNDPRCVAGLHAYPKPDKNHPVSASDISDGRLTVTCPRCQKTKTIPWRAGPPATRRGSSDGR